MFTEDLFQKLSIYDNIALLEVDVEGREWEVLGAILDNGILEVTNTFSPSFVCSCMVWPITDIHH